MYERFYGLHERPFDLTPDPRFLFLSPQHHETLVHLKYGLSGRPGITLVVGDAGTGKTTLIRGALQGLEGSPSRIAMIANPTLTRGEFYDHLAGTFGFSREAATSKATFLSELHASLEACSQAGAVLALIVDEAQSLPSELLEELRLLTNVEGTNGQSLTLLMVGQPELADRLNDPSLRQLKQRVALRANLNPFSLKETAGYIAARITVAGGRADQVFTRDAVLAIHTASKGLPRVISVLCDNALVTGFAGNVKPVGSSIIAAVCQDFDLPKVAVQEAPPPAAPVPAPPAVHVPAEMVSEPVTQASADEASPQLFDSYQAPTKRFSFFKGSRR